MLAKGSYPMVTLPFALTVLMAAMYTKDQYPLASLVLASLFLFTGLFFVYFFRDPEREAADGIVSPADGVVQSVIGEHGRAVVSIFMNLHNVHVNRAPLDGWVKAIEYSEGSHVPAYSKDSENNERNTVVLETLIGEVRVTQIAGALARRIVCYVETEQELLRGERFGMIRFGSRVDLDMPIDKVRIAVREGDRVLAGSTKLGEVRT